MPFCFGIKCSTNETLHVLSKSRGTGLAKMADPPVAFIFSGVTSLPSSSSSFQPCSDRNACNNHGTCIPRVPDMLSEVCLCEPGWVGKKCEFRFKPCEGGHPLTKDLCANEGRCYQVERNWGREIGCSCKHGWYGVRCHLPWPDVSYNFEIFSFLQPMVFAL